MDDFDEMNFLSQNQNSNLKALFEYYSEHETRRRIMKLCSQSSEDVVQLFQKALTDELDNNIEFIDKVISDEEKRTQLICLLDCILTELQQHTSNSLHLLIVKLQRKNWRLPFRLCISDNPHISNEIITLIANNLVKTGTHEGTEARSLAYHKNASSQVLHDLFKIKDLSTRKLIAKHSNTEERTLFLFLNHESLQVRRLIAEAPNSTSAMQMLVLKENDNKAVDKLSRNPNISDDTVTALLFSGDCLPTKKRLKQFLTDNPEYHNIKAIKKISGLKPKKDQEIPVVAEAELKETHLKRCKDLISSIQQ